MDKTRVKQIGIFGATAIVAGNMMGSGIAMLPANLAAIGSISLIGWAIAGAGALALAYVYAKLGTDDPQQGGPIAYAGEVAPILGYQTGVLYFNANWIGNLAIAITGVGYLSEFFDELNHAVPAGIASIVIIWIFTGINLLGAAWISRLVTIGVILLLIPVVLTGTVGWFFFDASQFTENWNVGSSHQGNFSAILASIILCIWAFIGVESSSVNASLVKNPKRTVPVSTMLGTCIAGGVYVLSCTAISGMFPAKEVASSTAPFSLAAGHMFGDWAPNIVSAVVAFACLASLGSWMMLVAQAGARGAKDGTLPKIFGRENHKGIPAAGIILSSTMMTALMVILMLISKGGNAATLFGNIASIAVLLTLPAYFYSALHLLNMHGFRSRKGVVPMIASIAASIFCFIALGGASRWFLAAAMVIMFAVFIFYAGKDRAEYARKVTAKYHAPKSELTPEPDAKAEPKA